MTLEDITAMREDAAEWVMSPGPIGRLASYLLRVLDENERLTREPPKKPRSQKQETCRYYRLLRQRPGPRFRPEPRPITEREIEKEIAL